MKTRIKTITGTIVAILLVILAGTPTQAAISDDPESIVYLNALNGDLILSAIYEADSRSEARQFYTMIDDELVTDIFGDMFDEIGMPEDLPQSDTRAFGAQGGKALPIETEFGAGQFVVFYAEEYVYVFVVIGTDVDDRKVSTWIGEVIEAETFVGVDEPRGYEELEG